MSESPKTTGIDQKKLRPLIEKVRARIKKHPIVKEMFEEAGIDLDEIDNIPMAFADLDVSAQTNKGCIYFNTKLVDDGNFEDDDHYLTHEISHWLQQTSGDKPTRSSDDGDYLENPAEVEAFQNQSKFLSDTRGDEAAEEYIEKVVDHHGLKGKKRKERMDALLELAEED